MQQALFRFSLIIFAASLTMTSIVWLVGSPLSAMAGVTDNQLKAEVNISHGAAAGYVADKTCSNCHLEIYQSYQHVGMSKSFAVPSDNSLIENFDLPPYFHQSSQRYYQLLDGDDRLLFKRWQLDEKGERINEFERKVDFILGSGHKTRAYLYREPGGELFQLPVGWYSAEQQWGMSPGYDNAQHQGVTRAVQRECLFCHNAYPQVEANSDKHWQPHLFPAILPQGTGCQRCHGPGGEHVKTVLSGNADLKTIHNSIVNPAKLEVAERDSICFQCHMLPSVDLTGPRKFDKPTYSFRPGEDINNYMHHVDVVDSKVKREDRFEINHHAYRLRQSACFNQSEGALSCISCHNPHKKVTAAKQAEHYGKVCQSCHEQQKHKPALTDNTDCISCHMPQRRTQDVVRVVMTDHKIQRTVKGQDYLKPIKEQDPILEDLNFLMPDKSPTGDMAQIYKVATLLRNSPNANYVDYLHSMLAKLQPKDMQPYFDLLQGQLMLKRYKQAEQLSRWLLKKKPGNFRVEQWLATALMGQGLKAQAQAIFKPLIEKRPDIAEIQFNYALLLRSIGEDDQALIHIENAIGLRQSFTLAWLYRAQIVQKQRKFALAVKYYQKALAIDPLLSRGYLGLSEVLLEQGEKLQAQRYLKHGLKFARQTKEISQALADLQSLQ